MNPAIQRLRMSVRRHQIAANCPAEQKTESIERVATQGYWIAIVTTGGLL